MSAESLPPAEEVTEVGRVSLAAALRNQEELRQYLAGNREHITTIRADLTEVRVRLESMERRTEAGTAAQIRMADLMEERAKLEREEREAARAAAEREAERSAQAWARVWDFVGANWRPVGLVMLVILYPHIVPVLQEAGLLPAFKADVAQPLPVVVAPSSKTLP